MRISAGSTLAFLAIVGCSSDSPAEPEPVLYTVGGTVAGLEGTGLVISNDFEDDLTPANGTFEFDNEYPDGEFYSVRIEAQPIDPVQVCVVENGTGVIAAGNVTNVEVTCGTPQDEEALDRTFDEDGRATVDLVGGAEDMVVQNDGRIVLINSRDVARLNADGSIDGTFGLNGIVRMDFPGTSDVLSGVALQPDGRIVIAGYTWFDNATNADVAVARLNIDGTLDGTFGTGGMATMDAAGFSDGGEDVLVQPDGRIVVGGTAKLSLSDGDFALFRFGADGTPDVDFGSGGFTRVDIGGDTDIPYAVALQPDGMLLLAGRVGLSGGADPDIAVARFNSDGTLDTGFGAGGITGTSTPDTWDEASDMVVQTDGRIVLSIFINPPFNGPPMRFGLMRLNADGTLDHSFGDAGFTFDAIFSDAGDIARAVTLQADGRIVAAGQKSNTVEPDFAIARYNADGSLDTTFDEDGMLSVDFFTSTDAARVVRISPDGGIIVAGLAREGSVTRTGVLKVRP